MSFDISTSFPLNAFLSYMLRAIASRIWLIWMIFFSSASPDYSHINITAFGSVLDGTFSLYLTQ